MIKTIAVSVSTLVGLSFTGTAEAQSLPLQDNNTDILKVLKKEEPKKNPEPIVYVVVQGDTLTSIAEKHQTTPERLFDKNLSITSPDEIKPAQSLTIPFEEEQLVSRTTPPVAESAVSTPQSTNSEVLVGSIGYAKAGGNCVKEPGVNSPHNGTNPIRWPVLSKTPTIGATALWKFNHTGVVTGIWSNGDLEIRHQNYRGGKHRFPASDFRGFR